MHVSGADRKVMALLIAGFAMIICLMLVTGQFSLDALSELGRGSAGMLTEEREGGRALSTALALEVEFDELLYSLPGTRQPIAPTSLSARLAALEGEVRRATLEGLAPGDHRFEGDEQEWRAFERAGLAFVGAVRAATAPDESPQQAPSTQAHREVIESMRRLALQSDRRNEAFVNEDREAFAAAVRDSIRLLAVTGALAVLVALATVFVVRRLVAQLTWQRAELARLSSDILQTQEVTLRQVSHDLHDQVGQTLTAIEANLGALDASSHDWAVKGRVEDCIGLVQDVMSQTRSMSQLLRPSLLDDFGLTAALEPFVQSFSQRTGIPVSFSSTVTERLSEDVETNLYRIVQESLTNVARHSGATRVDIALADRGQTFELVVEDNGKGLPKLPPGAGGVGLRSMRARATQIGGTLTLGRGASGGLRIVVVGPLERVQAHERENAITVG